MEPKLFEKRTQVSSFLFQELTIPALVGVDLNTVEARTDHNNLTHRIEATHRPNIFKIVFNRQQKVGEIVVLKVLLKNASGPIETVEKPQTDVAPAQPETPKKSFKEKVSFFKNLQAFQKNRSDLNLERNKKIREQLVGHPGLSGLRVLTIDFTGCWARGLGMLQKARQLQYQLKIPLHEHFDLITGQGDGAIIAAALAAGVSFDTLADWWTTDWRKVHSPGFLQKTQRWAVSKIKQNESGFNAKKARAALKKLFTRAKTDMRFKDVLTRLQITVTQADLNIHTHYSDQEPNMELYAAVEDSAVTKIHYNQKNTVKGAAVFLGAIEKNDVMGLSLSPENNKMSIISIGAPTRVNPTGAVKLARLGHAADKKALQDAGHFIYEKRVKQLMKQLLKAGYNVGYSRLECGPLDGVAVNTTDDAAMRAGIDSGSGKINLKFLAGGKNDLAKLN